MDTPECDAVEPNPQLNTPECDAIEPSPQAAGAAGDSERSLREEMPQAEAALSAIELHASDSNLQSSARCATERFVTDEGKRANAACVHGRGDTNATGASASPSDQQSPQDDPAQDGFKTKPRKRAYNHKTRVPAAPKTKEPRRKI